MHEPIGIIGLGRIGLAAAKAWLHHGYHVFGYDISDAACNHLALAGGTTARSAEEVARKAKVIIILVLNDEQAIAVMTGSDGILQGAGKDSTIICMSTIRGETLEYLAAKCAEKSVGLVDCPFTGGTARVAARTLTLIAAAPPPLLERVSVILETIGRIVYAGTRPGQGQAVKHCNQLLVGVTHAVTMEVIMLARKLGLDPAFVASVAGSGIAGSDYFRLLSESVLTARPSPGGLGQMCKDMDIVGDTLRAAGMQAYVGAAAARYFSAASRRGMGDREGADLITVVEELAAGGDAETENF